MSESIRTVFGPHDAQQAAEELAAHLAGDDLPEEEQALMRHLESVLTDIKPDLSSYEHTAVAFRAARLLKSRGRRGQGGLEARPTPATPAERKTPPHDPAAGTGPRLNDNGGIAPGRSLRKQRLEAGLSAVDLATRVGMPPHQVIQFESGARTLPADAIARLSAALSGLDEADETAGTQKSPAAPNHEIAVGELDAAALHALYRQLPKGVRRQMVALMRSTIAELGQSDKNTGGKA